ncbi:hypothetical protein FACS1894205_6770 [Alphaproteobacteria bacterium]|nr:hypothetical protein FACS1894205_6770 [Alphaproteobacteria bacterium]
MRVVLGKNQAGEKYSIADFLANQGVRVWIDAEHASAHNKVMIFDERLVLTGSFNFTKAAQDWNAENIVMLSSPAFTAAHIRNWQTHLKHSERYVGKGRR